MPVGEKQTYRFGPFELDTQCGQLRRDGVRLKLQGQPVQILEILLEKPGQLVTREELRERLWASDTFVDFDHSLNTAIKKLREALGDEADRPRYIETLPRRGYRFVGEVMAEDVRHEHSLSPIAADDVVRQVVTNLADAAITGGTESRSRTRRIRVVKGSVVAFLGIAICGYWITKPPPQPRIVGSHVLTKTGNPKDFLMKPFTDRGSLYFIDETPSGRVILQVPAAGGEVLRGPTVKGELRDISRDGSQLLSQTWNPQRNYGEVWTQSLSSGLPRLVVKDAYWPIWSADGRGIFFSRFKNNSPNDELYRSGADGTAVERLATLPRVSFPHLSPDGTRIRFTEGGSSSDRLWEVGTDGSNPHPILGDRKEVFGGVWSPDGKYYFFTAWDGDRMSLWAVSETRHWWQRNATVPQQLTFGPMSIGAPATTSNDRKQLYAVGAERHGELSVYDSKLRKFVPYLSGASICYVDFSRDGQWIAYVSYPEGTLWRSRIDGSEKRQLTVPPLAVINPRWSPDGKLIVFVDLSVAGRSQMTRGSPRRVYVVSADGGGPALLLAGQFGDPTWSPDGNSIAYDYNAFTAGWATEARILDLQTQKSTKVPGSEGMWSPRWSPDGKYLVALGSQAKLMLYTFATKSWEELDPGGHGWPCWSRDSKFVYAYSAVGDSLTRLSVSDHKKETTAPMQGFRGTAYYFDRWNLSWAGVTPNGRPIALRDTGVLELYAFDLEYK